MSYREYLGAVIAAQGGQDQILKAKLHIILPLTNVILDLFPQQINQKYQQINQKYQV